MRGLAVFALVTAVAAAEPCLAQELTRADLEAALRQRDQQIDAL